MLKIKNQLSKSTTLAEIRDTLLPKLISGQIRIPEELLGDDHVD